MTLASGEFLTDFANSLTIIGVVVGLIAFIHNRCVWRSKRKKLEEYLLRSKNEATGGKAGQHTITHLVRHVGLTEDEILKISFESGKLGRRVGPDEKGNAEILYIEHL